MILDNLRPRSVKAKRVGAMVSFVVLGIVLGGSALIGHHRLRALEILTFYVLFGVVVFFWTAHDTDAAAVLRADGDERQRQIDLSATAFSAVMMVVCCVIGAAVDLARGGSGGPWLIVAGVGGITYGIGISRSRARR